MKRPATTWILLLVALVATATLPTTASAALRFPQVPVLGGSLQAYLLSKGQAITVLTDQDATQLWRHTSSGNTTFTLMLASSPNAAANDFGIYNGSDAVPALNILIQGSTGPLAVTLASFKPGNKLVVNQLDPAGSVISTNTFLNVDQTGFGFWLKGPSGTVYTQDARNPGGKAQALTFASTGSSVGNWWLCFEETAIGGPAVADMVAGASVAAGSDQDFDDCVIFMESVNPTPVSSTTWGQLKARFR